MLHLTPYLIFHHRNFIFVMDKSTAHEFNRVLTANSPSRHYFLKLHSTIQSLTNACTLIPMNTRTIPQSRNSVRRVWAKVEE